MKPSFALDFRDGAVALLHRTSRGWQQVGATAFDAPDANEALAYLRSTALGLSPRGLACKLVIPNDQILYTAVSAPGPDAARRRKQIRAALEGLTPYKVDDLVFDWWGTGPELQVAVVARETLAEAEAFAAEHRFNPVSFVAVPDNGDYQAEPFFGPTALSVSLLADGEKVERDAEPIAIVARDYPRSDSAAAAPPPPAAAPAVAKAPDAVAVPQPEPEPSPVATEPFAPQATSALPDTTVQPAPVPEPAAEAPAQQRAVPEPEPEPQPVAASSPAPEIAGAKEVAPKPVDEALADDKHSLPDFTSVRVPPVGAASFDLKAMQVDLVDEAPMALDVSDDGKEPQAAVPPETAEPPPAAAETPAAAAKPESPQSPSPAILAAFANRRQVGPAPAPRGEAKPTDFAAAAAEARAKKTPSVGPAPSQRPSAARPPQAKPAAAAPAATRSPLPFPARGSAGAKAILAKAKPAAPVGATKSERNVVDLAKSAKPSRPETQGAQAAPRKGSVFEGKPAPIGGKSRYLGLILTGILLLALAAIAAWSSYSLSQNDADPGPAATENALASSEATAGQDTTLPTVEDEALADGEVLDPGADGATAPADKVAATDPAVVPGDAGTADQAASPAPDAGLSGQSVATATPGNDPQDEIFLAAFDTAPQTSDPAALPALAAASDPPPQLAAPPPPFGTVYTFDATGHIQPTPEGITTPEGVLLIAGRPGKVPPPRPAALVETAPTEAAPLAVVDPALAGKKPKARPEALVAAAAAPEAAQAPAIDTRLAGIRPLERPAALTQVPNGAEAASLASGDILQGTGIGLASSRKPLARPDGMDQAVDAAVAAALQAGTTDGGSETAAIAPEEQAEPEVESPAPDLPTSASVAKQATDKNALNLSKLALIGIFGSASNRYAMIRQSTGSIKRVRIGDTIDGGQIVAITATEVQYQKGGRILTLALPRG